MSKINLSKFFLLGCLYVSQYIPFAFFYQALPVFWRQHGMSLEAIGLLSLISLPWMLKFLWSPLIDRYSFTTLGHYRFWIICCQSFLTLTLVVCAFLDIQQNLVVILTCLFLMCFLAATQDIATDALAIGLLNRNERGLGNGVQSAGNYLGAILGGGGMLIALNRWGWTASLLTLALCVLLALIPVLRHKERKITRSTAKKPNFMALVNFCHRPGMGHWLLILILYMAATTMANTMFRPLLVDLGLSLADIGLLTGIVGFSASMLGALIAGVLITPLGRKRSLILFGILQAVAIATYILPAIGVKNLSILYLVCIAVQITMSMAYTIQFTIMMDKSELSTAATDYTLQTSILYFGGIIASILSGFITKVLGYTGLFAFCIFIGLVSVTVIARIFDDTQQVAPLTSSSSRSL
ncbi:MAG: MFS transporter [Nostoc sp.]|uniref:MFS transporter n=1 Tax=Nostoc sp. TaxID=1180 RepID=UPI002FF4EE14